MVTVNQILADIEKFSSNPPAIAQTGVNGWGGTNIIVSRHALEFTEERLFPASRYRSNRIRKKLIKRFGGEFRKKPCMWKTRDGYVCHPSLYAKLKANLSYGNHHL